MDAKMKALLAIVGSALACRCPRCGQGRLFVGFLNTVPVCAICGLEIAKHDSGDGPAVFLIFLLGAVIVPLAVWTDFAFSPPFWLHALIWMPVTLGVTVGLLRPAKALVIILQYRHRRADFDA